MKFSSSLLATCLAVAATVSASPEDAAAQGANSVAASAQSAASVVAEQASVAAAAASRVVAADEADPVKAAKVVGETKPKTPQRAGPGLQWSFGQASVTLIPEQGQTSRFTLDDPDDVPQISVHPHDALRFDFVTIAKVDASRKSSKQDGRRAHQTMLLFRDPATHLEAPLAATVKANGVASVRWKLEELPRQLRTAAQPLEARLVVGSFDTEAGHWSVDNTLKASPPSKPLETLPLFRIALRPPAPDSPEAKAKANAKKPHKSVHEKVQTVKYGPKEELRHTFRSDPQNPPKLLSLFFTAIITASFPSLLITWAALGANVKHLPTALKASPVGHVVFFSSIVAIEAVFALYYCHWTLFQTLPVVGALALVAIVSGSRALREVQRRRLAGER